MSYNQLYDQDSGENVSYNNFYRLDVDRAPNTLLPVIRIPKLPPVKPPKEPIEEGPGLSIPFVFDINFKDNLELDVGGPAEFVGVHTMGEGYVTVPPGQHLEINKGFPNILNYTGDQTWIINFKPISTKADGIQMWVQTTQVGNDFNQSIDQKTGINFRLQGFILQCGVFQGPRNFLANCVKYTEEDFTQDVHSVALMYQASNSTLKMFLDGVLVDTEVGPPASTIDWSTANNIYINRDYTNTPAKDTQYHRIAVVHRLLTDEEIIELYNSRGGVIELPPVVPDPNTDPGFLDEFLLFDINFNKSVIADVPEGFGFIGFADLKKTYVEIYPGYHLEGTGKKLPSFLNNQGDHSYVVNFRSLTKDGEGDKLFVNTTNQRAVNNTGFSIRLYNDFLLATLYKGLNDILVVCFMDLQGYDVSLDINSVAVTYSEATHHMKLYFNGGTPRVQTADVQNSAIDWSTSKGIYLNMSFVYTPVRMTEFHKMSIYDRVLTPGEILRLYNSRSGTVVDPSLVFDTNFNGSSMVPEIGEGVFIGYSIPNDGYVSIPGNSYIYLRDGMPEYLKSIEDQTWHIAFRSDSPSSYKMFLQNTRVTSDFNTSVNQRTGFYIIITGTFIQTIFFRGRKQNLVAAQSDIGGVDLSVGVHSVTVTYLRESNTIWLYFDGALLSTASAHPDIAGSVISWETAESIYINRYYNLMPANATDYHKLSIFNRTLGADEVLLLHNESG